LLYQITASVSPVQLAELASLPLALDDGVELGIAGEPRPNEIRVYARRRIDLAEHPLPTMTRNAEGTPSLEFPINPDRDKLLAPLHFIEAFGNLLFGVRRVEWLEATEEWIPENDEDRSRLQADGTGGPGC
jgi:hypothetical protein